MPLLTWITNLGMGGSASTVDAELTSNVVNLDAIVGRSCAFNTEIQRTPTMDAIVDRTLAFDVERE